MCKSDNSMWIVTLEGASAAALSGGTSMRDVIAFILGNFTLTFFVAGLLASAIALWRAPTAQLCADRRSAVLVFRAVLDRIFKPLQFRLARFFREIGGELHRMGGQSL